MLAITIVLGCGQTSSKPHEGARHEGVTSGSAEREVLAVSMGNYNACAVLASGEVWCWGANVDGQLGTGDTNDRSTPAQVVGLPARALALSLGGGGSTTSCAIVQGGTVWCWGRLLDASGRGRGPTVRPVQIASIVDATQLSVSQRHACVVTAAGAVLCWGDNAAGDLGDSTTEGRDQPVAVVGLPPAVQVETGYNHSCALARDGAVWCWGANDHGSLGNGLTKDSRTATRASIERVKALGPTMADLTQCALDQAGAVWCWGSGRLEPGLAARIEGLPKATAVLSSCAVVEHDELRCWRDSEGNSVLPPRRVAVKVLAASSNASSTCVVTTEKGLSCWGANANSDLGLGDTAPRDTPTPVSFVPHTGP